MAHQLPSLNALRAFEAAGRHLSFTRAARELHVTPAAISHQVKALEAHLGVPLFRRLNRALLLTDAGQLCLPGIGEGFDRLAAALARLETREGRGALTVSVSPSFASKWLVPRLEHFTAAHPETDVRISATMDLVDFGRENVDLAIRYGHGVYPGLRVEKLLDDTMAPVCSPRLRDGPSPIRGPGDLRHHTLLHDDSLDFDAAAPDWRMWLKAAGVEGVDPERGPRFSQADLSLQAAIDGVGVALGFRSLVANDLAAGRLVMPFDLSLPLSFAYYVVAPESAAERPKVADFRDWLLAEAAASGPLGQATNI
jgi:LysR family glycine cleavage system transcriptional activator